MKPVNRLSRFFSVGGVAAQRNPPRGGRGAAFCPETQGGTQAILSRGRRVRVCKGIFAGLEGTVVEHLAPSRLVIAADLQEGGITLEVDARMVEPIFRDRST